MSSVHYRTCNLCEAMCGLEIEHDGSQVLQVRGDARDPFSKGHLCPKGARIGDVHSDPNRLRKPLRRRGKDFEEISWAHAFDIVAENLNRVRQAHGNDAVALYFGNPTVHNLGTLMWVRGMRQALGTKNLYTATSVDQLPHHFAAYYMFGDPLRLPVPDIDRADFLVLIGANPLVSNGSMMSAAGIGKRLEAIRERGGSWIAIDPRKTETAKRASEHHSIGPGSDAYFLLGLLHVIMAEGPKPGSAAAHLSGLDTLASIAQPWSPERTALLTGIQAETTRRIALTLLRTPRACIFGRMGVSTHPQGGLCQWLLHVINAVSGHLDSEGGLMFPQPAIEIARDPAGRKKHNRWQSRVRKLAEFNGEFPVATLADEILTPGRGQVRAFVSSCGNPLLSTPDSARLKQALQSLDFMVSIDIYLNETSRHANIILPPATGLEVDHYDLVFHALAVSNSAKFSPALFAPEAGQHYDYQIYGELTRRLAKKAPLKRRVELGLTRLATPRRLVQLGLLTSAYNRFNSPRRLPRGLGLKQLLTSVHGIDLGPLTERLPGILATRDRKVHLAPAIFVEALEKLSGTETKLNPGEFRLIGRRHLRSNNSWMHNSAKLMSGKERCTIQLHSDDAARLGLLSGQRVRVRSRVGSIELALQVSNDMSVGVACIPHGFGHDDPTCRLDVASAHPGANVNQLMDSSALDPLTGNAAFSGQIVSVEAI